MKEWFNNLGESERRTLILAIIALVPMAFYALVWDPVMSSVHTLRENVQRETETVVWMRAAVEEYKALAGSQAGTTVARGGQSLLAIVDSTAKRDRLGDALKRVEPKGQNEVRVRFEDVSFDGVIKWLASLQKSHGVIIDTVSIDRQPTAGLVNVNITLKDAAT